MLDGVESDLYRILAFLLGVDRHIDSGGYHPELLAGGGAVHVGSYQQWTLAACGAQLLGELARECGLSRALESRHQDHSRVAVGVERGFIAAHQRREFVMNDLDHQLLWLEGIDHVLSQRFLLHCVGECLGHLVVDIGVKQRAAHILEGFGNVYFRDAAFTL